MVNKFPLLAVNEQNKMKNKVIAVLVGWLVKSRNVNPGLARQQACESWVIVAMQWRNEFCRLAEQYKSRVGKYPTIGLLYAGSLKEGYGEAFPLFWCLGNELGDLAVTTPDNVHVTNTKDFYENIDLLLATPPATLDCWNK